MRTPRLLLVSLLFLFLVNEPILSIVDRPVLVLGLPLLFVYVLSVWGLAIAATAWVIATTEDSNIPANSVHD